MPMHRCKAGITKLVVMYNGNIIPCEAFKGLLEKYPQFILGNIHRGDTLEDALKQAEKVPFLQWIRSINELSEKVEKEMCGQCDNNPNFKKASK